MEKKIVRFDIETAPLYSSEEDMPADLLAVWGKKYSSKKPEKLTDFERYFQKSPLFAEFSRVVCISLGYAKQDFGEISLDMTSIVGDEVDMLEQLRSFLSKLPSDKRTLGGHNIKGFDVPFLAKRYIINGLTVPPLLTTTGMKPWDVLFFDTMEYRKMGGYSSTGLETICTVLGVPTPKNGIDGSMVGSMFHDDLIQNIITYCENDVEAVYRCRCKMTHKADHVMGCDDIPEVSDQFVGLWAWKELTGIKDLTKMSRNQKLRFTKFIEKYHADHN